MALPQGWIYTEIVAPDVRFVAVLVLALLCLLPLLRVRPHDVAVKRNLVLFITLVGAFALWLLSTGNGRYFMPFMLLVGPLCVGLLHGARLSRFMKGSGLVVVVLLQFFVVRMNSPWAPFNAVELIRWTTPDYVELDVRPVAQLKNITYVSYIGQSYSLIAPLFPATSHWINLSTFADVDFFGDDRVLEEARRRLRVAADLRVIVPSAPTLADRATGLPSDDAIRIINGSIRQFGLSVDGRAPCVLLRSGSFAQTTLENERERQAQKGDYTALAGFWVCPIRVTGKVPIPDEIIQAMKPGAQAIQKLERLCPRVFSPGQLQFRYVPGGLARIYINDDVSLLYDHANGGVSAQFFRALNPQWLGRAADILKDDFRIDCEGFVSRERLPWNRQI